MEFPILVKKKQRIKCSCMKLGGNHMDSNKRPDTMERITTPALAEAFIEEQVAAVREQVGDKKVLLALSGGVDMSLIHI